MSEVEELEKPISLTDSMGKLINFMGAKQGIDVNALSEQWDKEYEEKTKGMTEDEKKIYLLKEELEERNAVVGTLTELDCPKCKNRGNYYVIEEGKLELKFCECMQTRRSIQMINKSGLSEVIRAKTFSSYIAKEPFQIDIKRIAMNYVKQGGNNWFLVCGQSGSGKSHICTAIVGELLKQNNQVIYLPYREEIPKLKRNALDDKYYTNTIDKWNNCKILYIDDLFKGMKRDNASADIAIIFELIDFRCRNNKRTIISTECLFEELLEIDEAIGGRIIEMCGSYKAQISKDFKKNYRTQGLY